MYARDVWEQDILRDIVPFSKPQKGKKGNAKGKDQMNDGSSGMDIDYEYFCSLFEKTAPFAMFPCAIRGKRGIALLDTGATHDIFLRLMKMILTLNRWIR